jgi:hypothetical protein
LESYILKEMEKLASTEWNWRETNKLCERINSNNAEYKLDMEMHNCDRNHEKAIKIRKVYKQRLKQIISNIDWGSGLKLEYLDLFNQPSGHNCTTFLIRKPASQIYARAILAAFKKVCESDFPRNIREGSVCVIFGEVPADYRQQGGKICHAHYYGLIG